MKNFRGILLCFCIAPIAFAAEDPRFEQGARFESAGQYEKALGEYRSILASEPHNAKAFYAAGSARFKMKDYKGAVANYRLAYKFNPQMLDAYEGAAKAFEKLGSRDSAAAERKKSPAAASKTETPKPTASPSDSKFSYTSAAFLKAKQAFNAKEYKTACSAAREVLQQEPGNPGAYYYAGAGRYELGEWDKAEYNLKRAFDYPELGYNAHYYLSLIYKRQGKRDAERAELESYVKLSKNESAVEKARKRIAELSSPQSVADSAVGKVQESAAVSEEKPSVKEPPEPESKPAKPSKPSVPTFESANDAFRQGDYTAALSQYQALQKKTRDENAKAYLLLQIGNVYRARRDFRSAVSRYRESVERYPGSEWALEAQRAWEDAVWQEKNAGKLPR